MLTKRLRQLGQGMTEYIIIVALIAIAGIAIFTMFGDVVREQMGIMTEELAGQQGGTVTQQTTTEAAGKATLSDFESNKNIGK